MKRKGGSKEPQYQIQVDNLGKLGPVEMGPTASHTWRSDPRRLLFLMSRYKFCSKLLAGKSRVLEVGCGDGFGMRILLQTVGHVHGIDFDPIFIDWAKMHAEKEGLSCSFSILDITEKAPKGSFDAACSLDLIEHIDPAKEARYWKNVSGVLKKDAPFIVGTPNIAASAHASVWSREGHINLKSADSLRDAASKVFENVFLFSMNDEVVHTGYSPMAHYLFALCTGIRKGSAA
ncbi:MAG: class I SAM-dependent methyltransferase [Deltaproteobacteria bacterium]|nr:class I SAM-dependent methyltransferase [Deltaproteobacteria bacterium]